MAFRFRCIVGRRLGLLGANVPALLRALVACGWFGIQTWIGGAAIYSIVTTIVTNEFNPEWKPPADIGGLGINWIEIACFLFFWAINMWVIYKGIESIRILLNIKAPLLIAPGPRAAGVGLLCGGRLWRDAFAALKVCGGRAEGGASSGRSLSASLTANVGFWATLSLNIPDFSRYAYSQRDQALGQALGLPTTMALFSFIGIAVTSATAVIYGQTIWDPIVVLSKFTNPLVLVIAMLSLCIATLATNIAANVVSPANDFAHLAPRWISFRTGGLITGIMRHPDAAVETA